jgi:hypothetical protein
MNGDQHVERTIELVQSQVRDLEQQLTEKKRMVNSLCGLIGRAPVYANADPISGGSMNIRPDEFYGKGLATAVRAILDKRNAAGMGAASVQEIYDLMIRGGFRFEAKNEANAKRALTVSLAKNTVTFHRLPNGYFGLAEWYPEAVKAKTANGAREEAKQSDKEEELEEYPNDFMVEHGHDEGEEQRQDDDAESIDNELQGKTARAKK